MKEIDADSSQHAPTLICKSSTFLQICCHEFINVGLYISIKFFTRSRDNSIQHVQPANNSRFCALQKSLYAYSTRTTETIMCPSIWTCFNTITKGYNFYNLYNWEMGFGIQYGKSWKNSKKIHAMQEFNCLCGVCEFGAAEPKGDHVRGRWIMGCVRGRRRECDDKWGWHGVWRRRTANPNLNRHTNRFHLTIIKRYIIFIKLIIVGLNFFIGQIMALGFNTAQIVSTVGSPR